MAHHKRRRPKHQRGGCLFCKSHKHEGAAKIERNPKRLPKDQDIQEGLYDRTFSYRICE